MKIVFSTSDNTLYYVHALKVDFFTQCIVVELRDRYWVLPMVWDRAGWRAYFNGMSCFITILDDDSIPIEGRKVILPKISPASSEQRVVDSIEALGRYQSVAVVVIGRYQSVHLVQMDERYSEYSARGRKAVSNGVDQYMGFTQDQFDDSYYGFVIVRHAELHEVIDLPLSYNGMWVVAK